MTYTDVLPDIAVTKTAGTASVPETGGNVTFTYVVTNNSLEAAEITVLSDNRFGVLSGDADCQVGTVLAGSGGTCSFAATFAVPAGDVPGTHVNTVTAQVSNGNLTASATDSETVTYTDVLPDIAVTKTASTASVPETGGNVTFTYVVTNTGTVPVMITSLVDDQFTISGDADCQVETLLGVGESCSFD